MAIILNGTGGEVFPSWTTAGRPASPATSQTGYNTTLGTLEFYNGTTWVSASGQSVTPAAVSGQANTATSYFAPPSGTTAQRPGSPTGGMLRFNTTTNQTEIYSGIAWTAVTAQSYTLSWMLAAGGGGGGTNAAGGGGGGGYLSGSFITTGATSYPITIGAGGALSFGASTSSPGGDSTFNSNTAIGGGGGGSNANLGSGAGGGSGGSGGGGGVGSGSGAGGGAGTSGQGYAGGSGNGNGSSCSGGGGGGAAAAGTNSGSTGGNGGNGISNNISGTATYYCGGGFGAAYNWGGPGSNGAGGGGAANTGGGGESGVTGGSGICIISYINGSQIGSGGTVTSYTVGSDTYWVHTFTTSGTYTA